MVEKKRSSSGGVVVIDWWEGRSSCGGRRPQHRQIELRQLSVRSDILGYPPPATTKQSGQYCNLSIRSGDRVCFINMILFTGRTSFTTIL
ncbi:hypothetical protein L1987_05765 [Smallanthus sonchifolius]|uniref:Uncharacterized protein n=1 Tax=Smallanthus sonchifolius TaxID=185202 RepID=A0ACB9JW96_9ASTR|nr:hypothetical protein L1987_05765 [Smallanthus sonchifolius]